MGRYVSRPYLSNDVCAPAVHISKSALRYGIVTQVRQQAVVASSIFVVAWLLNVEKKPTITEIANVTKASEAEVKEAYAAIRCNSRTLLADFKGFTIRLPG